MGQSQTKRRAAPTKKNEEVEDQTRKEKQQKDEDKKKLGESEPSKKVRRSTNGDTKKEEGKMEEAKATLAFTPPVLANIEIGIKLAEGNFGDVYKGLWRDGEVALKVIKNPEEQENFKKEIAVSMQMGSQPFVVQFYGIYIESDKTYIVMEYLKNRDLLSYLRRNSGELKPEDLLDIIKCFAFGMSYFEEKKIIHRDLAARNLLVKIDDGKYSVKISDLGMSRQSEEYKARSDFNLPVRWCAPEVLKHRVYAAPSDVWSFGVVCWEILSSGAIPYGNLSNDQVCEAVLGGEKLPKPPLCQDELWAIIENCFEEDPDRRPTFSIIARQIKDYMTRLIDHRTQEESAEEARKADEETPYSRSPHKRSL